MPNFIEDGTALEDAKTDKTPLSVGQAATKHIKATDWNGHRQALIDTQAHLRGAKWYALAEQASDPVPAGIDDYLWIDDTGGLHLTFNGNDVPIGAGSFVSVKQYGAVGDGVANDTAAIQAAHVAAVAAGLPLYFPPGTYKLVSVGAGPGPDHCLIVADSQADVRWFGNATITWDTFVGHAVFVGSDVRRMTVEGLKFQGRTDALLSDRWEVNLAYAFYVDFPSTDLVVDRCFFDHVSTVFYRASDNQQGARLLFSRNVVTEAPSAMNGPSYSKIVDNWFINSAIVPTRSHGIYLFGHTEKAIIRGNHFKNIATSDIKINATDARLLQKRVLVISDNVFEGTGHNAITLGTAQTVNLGSILISRNVFKNCNGAMTLEGARDCTISANLIEADYEYQHSPIGGYAIAVITLNPKDMASGIVIDRNQIVTRHPHVAKLVIASEPADGDTVVVGAVTYTWRTTPTTAGDVQRNASVDACAASLAATIGGVAGGAGDLPMNLVCRNYSDVFFSSVFGEGIVVIVSELTFTATTTGANASFVTQRASLSCASDPFLGGDNQLDTILEWVAPGTGGNDGTLTTVNDGAGTGSITRAGNDFTYHYQAGTSTVANFEGLVAALAGGDALMRVKTAGTQAQVLAAGTAFAAIHFSNGRDAVVDFTGVNRPGVSVSTARDVTISYNSIDVNGTGIVIAQLYRPRIVGNDVWNSTLGIASQGCVFPYFESNRLTNTNDRPGLPSNIDSQQILVSYDAFPVIRNMDLIGRESSPDQQKLLPFMRGTSGVVPIGDGKEHGFVFYGMESSIDGSDAGEQSIRWKDGDVFAVLDDSTTYTFTFKRSGPNGTSEFNSYAGLIALINDHTGGTWTASNPVDDYFGADSLAFGYIHVKRAAAEVANGYMAAGNSTKRMSLMNGVLLRKWTEGDTFSYMAGGCDGDVIRTVFYTPLASRNTPLLVRGIDADSDALDPVAYQADVIPGVCYVISHGPMVTGNEKFFVQLGG